ncbi:hypothetical protein C8Q75DRAFT_178861 [Abortiporus biennis]|nr:hypothetical protein C8Q75DRAFT_178861 [Abortiporus biennis]
MRIHRVERVHIVTSRSVVSILDILLVIQYLSDSQLCKVPLFCLTVLLRISSTANLHCGRIQCSNIRGALSYRYSQEDQSLGFPSHHLCQSISTLYSRTLAYQCLAEAILVKTGKHAPVS